MCRPRILIWWEGNPLDHGFTDAMTHGDHSRGGRHGDVGLKIGRDTMQPIYEFVDKANVDWLDEGCVAFWGSAY